MDERRGRKRAADGSERLQPHSGRSSSRQSHASATRRRSLSRSMAHPTKHRRRDSSLDSTLRGRVRMRSPSPPRPSATDSRRNGKAQDHKRRSSSPNHFHRRRRSRSPSRPHSPRRSRSPHLRRYRSYSRSPSYERYRHRHRPRHAYRRPDEELIRQEEEARDGGHDRYQGVIDEEPRSRWTAPSSKGSYWKGPSSSYHGDSGTGQDNDGEQAVKFKGRGSMKYRERNWR